MLEIWQLTLKKLSTTTKYNKYIILYIFVKKYFPVFPD